MNKKKTVKTFFSPDWVFFFFFLSEQRTPNPKAHFSNVELYPFKLDLGGHRHFKTTGHKGGELVCLSISRQLLIILV